jgi:hypothetical protein
MPGFSVLAVSPVRIISIEKDYGPQIASGIKQAILVHSFSFSVIGPAIQDILYTAPPKSADSDRCSSLRDNKACQ